MSDSRNWKMPKVSIGDCVLYSNDIHNFSDPTIGWVMRTPKESTVTVLAFTPAGFVEKSSVHHKDDPTLHSDHGWENLGVWDYTPQTKAIYEATARQGQNNHQQRHNEQHNRK